MANLANNTRRITLDVQALPAIMARESVNHHNLLLAIFLTGEQ